jgi:rare lipoprotein A
MDRTKDAHLGISILLLSFILLASGFLALSGCCCITGFQLGKGAVKTTYKVTKGATKLAIGTGKAIYTVGGFTFRVVMAPLNSPLTRDEIETIDGLSPKEAIKQGRVKSAPYVVYGRKYVPMSVEEAQSYEQEGVASWYGEETRKKKGGHMTANGEAFDPDGLTAAHKYLPLPFHVRVKNLDNGRSILVRVNDRGPFVEGRIIDLSVGAARKLGFFKKGTARVLVEAVEIEE